MSAPAVSHTRQSAFVHPPREVGRFGIEPGMKVADFGAGSGAYTELLSEAVTEAGAVYAVDVQKDLLRRIANHARERHRNNVRVIWGDLEHPEGTKLKSGLLDLVLVSNLLFQLEAPDRMLAEALRVLKPSGRCVVIDWEHSAPKGVSWGPHRRHVIPRAKACALLEAAGFDIEREWDAGSAHYCVVARARKNP